MAANKLTLNRPRLTIKSDKPDALLKHSELVLVVDILVLVLRTLQILQHKVRIQGTLHYTWQVGCDQIDRHLSTAVKLLN